MSMRRVFISVCIAVALMPFAVFAQATESGGMPDRIVPCNGVDCTCDDLITLAQNIINSAIFLAVFLGAMLFAYAGWLYLSNEAIGEQQRAKSLFKNVAIGLLVLMAAWLVVDTLMGSLLRDNISWNAICSTLKL